MTDRNQHNKKGRSKQPADKFVALRAGLRQSEAWRSLSFPARAVLIEVMAGAHRANNGTLRRSIRFIADLAPCAPSTVQGALRELIDKGFIVRTQDGCLGQDWKGQAARWRITEIGTAADPMPTKDYLAWNSKKTKRHTAKQYTSPGFAPSGCTAKQYKSTSIPGVGERHVSQHRRNAGISA